MSTRIIGAIIMTHGDDNGLVLPPAVAPVQVVILPIAAAQARRSRKRRRRADATGSPASARVKLDDSEQSAGWKFAEYEMKGVPLRLELGPRDIENGTCVLVRRDNRKKTVARLDELDTVIPQLLKAVHDGLYEKALARREAMTYAVRSFDELKDTADNKPGSDQSHVVRRRSPVS